jgi:hypothetical protein
VLFLVGARRSGTNWLERTLTAHPAVVAMSSETYLFSHGVAPLAERFQHANPASPMMGKTFMQRDAFLDGVRDLIDRALLDNLDAGGKDARYILERTPWHAQHLPLIAGVYPDARVLHIVRDGRAVARSLMSVEWGPSTMAEAAAEWRDSVTGGRSGAGLFGEHYREIVYERLLQDTSAGVDALFAWLDLEVPDELKRRILFEAGSEFNVDPSSPRVQADKWRDELTSAELSEFERVAGAELDVYGYPRMGSAEPSSFTRRGRRLRHPRAAARRARDRAFARWARREIRSNHAIASRFDELLSLGDDAGALALLSPKARISVVDGASQRGGRGHSAAAELVAAAAEHRSRGQRTLSGRIHLSPQAFTTVGTYELDDGSRWGRTLVLYVQGGSIHEASLYRFALHK